MKTFLIPALMSLLLTFTANAQTPWTAEWIWDEGNVPDCYFRKTVDLKEIPVSAKIAITADNIFTLYVNGSEVGHDADWTSLETYDILALLKPGKNVIAIHGSDPGRDISAVIAEGSINFKDSTYIAIATSKEWKYSTQYLEGWNTVAFDDSKWGSPRIIGKPPIGPWGGFQLPDFMPPFQVEILKSRLPEGAKPGDTVSIDLTVKASRRQDRQVPAGVRLVLDGERVADLYGNLSVPAEKWEPGKEIDLKIEGLRIPNYIPSASFEVQLLAPSNSGSFGKAWFIGTSTKKESIPEVSISNVTAKVVDGKAIEWSFEATARNPVNEPLRPFVELRDDKEHALIRVSDEIEPDVFNGKKAFEGQISITGIPGGKYFVIPRFHTLHARIEPVLNRGLGIQIELPPTTGNANVEPLGNGTFLDRDGRLHFWYINENSTLIWDGEPYIPVGGMYLSTFLMGFNSDDPKGNEDRYNNDVSKLKMMADAGVTDLYLNPCTERKSKPRWVWQRINDMFEEAGMNYGWQTTEQLSKPTAFHIAQDEYEQKIEKSGTYTTIIRKPWYVDIDPKLRILYSLINTRTGELMEVGLAKVSPEGNESLKAEATVDFPGTIEGRLAFFPEYKINGDYRDYWTDVTEGHLGELREYYGKMKMGPGFRMFIDALDNEQSLRNMTRTIPSGEAFRAQLAEFLKGKYNNLEALVQSWGLEDAPKDWDEASGLVPVGKPDARSDMGYAFNPNTGFRTQVDLTISQMWDDVLQFRDESVAEYNNKVDDALKAAQNVPCVHKLTDLESTTNIHPTGGMDGVGMEAYSAAPELTRGCGGGVYSRAQQAARTMWELVTETGRANPDYVAYGSPFELVHELTSMVEIGAKGTYVFYMNAGGDWPGSSFYKFNLFVDPRQLYWLGCYSKMMKQSAKLPIQPTKADFSFPAHRAGAEAFRRGVKDYNGDIASQSLPGYNGTWVVPAMNADHLPMDAQIIFNLEDAPATRRWAPVFERELKSGRPVALVGMRRNLGALSVDAYYTDQISAREDGTQVQILKPPAGAEILGQVKKGPFGFRKGALTIYALDYWKEAARFVSSEQEPFDFVKNVLGAERIDQYGVIQGYHFGEWTYLWNLAEEDSTIGLKVNQEAHVILPDGTAPAAPPASVTLPANAERPLIIQSKERPRFSGFEAIGEKESIRAWEKALASAKEAGLAEEEIGPKPESVDAILKQSKAITERAFWARRTMSAPPAKSIILDGDLSDWKGIPPVQFDVQVKQDTTVNEIYPGAWFSVAWDGEGLMIAVSVEDEKLANANTGARLWDGDAVEVFIETKPGDNKGHGQYDEDTRQFLFAPTNMDGKPEAVFRGGPNFGAPRVPVFSRHAVKMTEKGWDLECRIDGRDLGGWTPQSGDKIGFSLALDDSDGGARRHQVVWKARRDVDQNRETFGRLLLTE